MTVSENEDEEQEEPKESSYRSFTYTHVEKLEQKRVFFLMSKGGGGGGDQGRKHERGENAEVSGVS